MLHGAQEVRHLSPLPEVPGMRIFWLLSPWEAAQAEFKCWEKAAQLFRHWLMWRSSFWTDFLDRVEKFRNDTEGGLRGKE